MNRSLVGMASALAILVSVSPSMSQAQRPGGGQRGIDSSRYVRTSAPTDPIIQQMWTAGMDNGQAMSLAQVLLDSIGPRLTNTDRFDAGQDWLVRKYAEWGIAAEREQYGTWVKWHRGPTYLDLVQPRVRTLEATILGWSPGTEGEWIEAEAVIIPPKTTPEAFAAWLPSVRAGFRS